MGRFKVVAMGNRYKDPWGVWDTQDNQVAPFPSRPSALSGRDAMIRIPEDAAAYSRFTPSMKAVIRYYRTGIMREK